VQTLLARGLGQTTSGATSGRAAGRRPTLARMGKTRNSIRLGRLVKQLRKARGFTQESLSERSGLASDTIRRMEYGDFSPSLETLIKLCGGLDTSLATLFASFDGSDDATAREILEMARRMSRLELALAVRLISLLAGMLRLVAEAIEDAGDDA
jgi:transcriptional regulator with XRE-family HTH domain